MKVTSNRAIVKHTGTSKTFNAFAILGVVLWALLIIVLLIGGT